MHGEYRDEWECCWVHHDGEGPRHSPWETILVAHVCGCTAIEAAQCFAEGIMIDSGRTREDYEDDDSLVVAVKTREGLSYFRCTKRVRATIEARAHTPSPGFVLAN